MGHGSRRLGHSDVVPQMARAWDAPGGRARRPSRDDNRPLRLLPLGSSRAAARDRRSEWPVGRRPRIWLHPGLVATWLETARNQAAATAPPIPETNALLPWPDRDADPWRVRHPAAPRPAAPEGGR